MSPGDESVSGRPAEDWAALEAAVKHFERAWRQGLRPAINDYLHAGGPGGRLLIELVHLELELRLKAGEAARAEEYLTRYPELAGDPAAALDLIAAEQDLAGRRPPGHGRRFTVGREPELAALRAGFEAAVAGSGLTLCVTGEPGLGKTTLVEDFFDLPRRAGRRRSAVRRRPGALFRAPGRRRGLPAGSGSAGQPVPG
jgi:hypothetical protein